MSARRSTHSDGTGGPQLPTMGIWKDIYIESFDERIADIHTVILSADSGKAEVKIHAEIETVPGREITCHITLGDAAGTISRKARKKRETISEKFVIKNPKLWWPNGYGNPDLYPLTVKIELDGKVIDVKGD